MTQGRVIGRMRLSAIIYKQLKTSQCELQPIYLCPMIEFKGALAFRIVVAMIAKVIEGTYNNLYNN